MVEKHYAHRAWNYIDCASRSSSACLPMKAGHGSLWKWRMTNVDLHFRSCGAGLADDYRDADGSEVLTFGQAQRRMLAEKLDDNARGRVIDWIAERKRDTVKAGAFPGVDAEWISVDTPLPFSLKKLWHDLRWEIDATYPKSSTQVTGPSGNSKVLDQGNAEKLLPARFEPFDGTNIIQSKSVLTIRKQLDTLASRMRDPRLKFLFDPGLWNPTITHQAPADFDDLLAGWLGDGGESSEPITILDLSGIPASVLTDLVGALLRLLFDALFGAEDCRRAVGRDRS
jgi:hypothetical protein